MRRRFRSESESGENEKGEEGSSSHSRMKSPSCKEEYCRELKRENDELKSKVNFLRFFPETPISFSDVVLVASDEPSSPTILAHRALLISRSPVFKAMLENQMEESLSDTINIGDVSYNALRAFVDYLYTAKEFVGQPMACDLLVLADRYQVEHLKSYCEKYLMSKLNSENSFSYLVFARQYGAKSLFDEARSLVADIMNKHPLELEESLEIVEDSSFVADIKEAYHSKYLNTAMKLIPSAWKDKA